MALAISPIANGAVPRNFASVPAVPPGRCVFPRSRGAWTPAESPKETRASSNRILLTVTPRAQSPVLPTWVVPQHHPAVMNPKPLRSTRPFSIASTALLLATVPAMGQSLFEPEVSLARTRSLIVDVAAGDFTGNGESDMLLIENELQGFHISEGRSTGGFAFPVREDLPEGKPTLPVAGDFDGDGSLDFAAMLDDGSSQSLVTILRRPGSPWEVVTVEANPGTVDALTVADLDGDGDCDLVARETNGQVRGYRNAGVSFTTWPLVPQGASKVTIADLNVDGRDDVIFFDTAVSQWRVILGENSWFFVFARPFLPAQIAGYESLATGDLDGDGDIDLMLEVPAGGPLAQDQLIAMENLGGLLFGVPFGVPIPGIAGQGDLRLHDLDGDGLADPIYSPGADPSAPGDIVFQLNQGSFLFGAPTRLLNGPNALLDGTRFLDANGDGQSDIWLPGSPSKRARLYTHEGGTAGTWFRVEDAFEVFPAPLSLAAPFFLDVDQDGDLDIAVSSTVSSSLGNPIQRIFWLENYGALRFSHSRPLLPDRIPGALSGVGDFDGDGIDDLLLAQRSFTEGRAVVRFGLGAGGFSPEVVVGSVPGGRYGEFRVVDRDADGSDEIVANQDLMAGTNVVEMSFVSAGALFTETTLVSIAPTSNIALADFNNDGVDDLTLSSLQGTFIALGQPGGAFGAPQQFNGGSFAIVAPFALDVDQDGDNDLVTRSSTFGAAWGESEYPFGMNPLAAFPDPLVTGFRRFSAADLNGDGLKDIIGAGNTVVDSASTVVFLAQPGGSFQMPQVVAASSTSINAAAEVPSAIDLDSDGDLDVVVISDFSKQVVLCENTTVAQAGEADPGCMTGNLNSTGRSGEVVGYGSDSVSSTDLRLTAVQLPANMFGFFIGSQTSQSPMAIPGSEGAICLGGSIGRYDAPSQIKDSGLAGTFSLDLDPAALEVGPGQVPAVAGQAWYFQAWHRDITPQGATSNLTNSRRIVFTP